MSDLRFALGAILSLLACVPAGARPPASRPTGFVDNCAATECHADMLTAAVLHGPAARRKCESCHTLADPAEHRFTLFVPRDRLCASCHVQTYRTFVHAPVAEGECTGCHDPHGSANRFMLVDEAAGGLCFRCHPEEEFKSKRHVHGPVAAGACIVCHTAHSSWHPRLLVTDEQNLCQSCHDDVMTRLRLSRHPHEPVLGGHCLTCHDPHASDYRAQLRGGARQLCLSCHDQIKELVETSRYVHGAVTGEASCTACHTGHGGPLPKLLAAPLLNLCLSCHDKPLKAADGRPLVNIGALLAENPNQHGPVRRANCSACHNPHASSNARGLVKEYTGEFYAPFDLKRYELCFTCHLTEMVTQENGVGVTGFRDGERNLHFLHVNKKRKGRTCRTCHEVHASKRPFHIREKVPFGAGGWEIEINFEARPTGGQCAPGCHEQRSYSRVQREPAPSGSAGMQLDVSQ